MSDHETRLTEEEVAGFVQQLQAFHAGLPEREQQVFESLLSNGTGGDEEVQGFEINGLWAGVTLAIEIKVTRAIQERAIITERIVNQNVRP